MNHEMKKAAVIFPGIGYHTDKPLLYYGKKIAEKAGYHIIEVPYGNFETGIKGDPEKIQKAFVTAMSQTETMLQAEDFSVYQELLFISKSIGTAVAVAYAQKHKIRARQILFTPVEDTFSCLEMSEKKDRKNTMLAFYGTGDSWMSTGIVNKKCGEYGIRLKTYASANHSLETGNVKQDILILSDVMQECDEFINCE